MTDNEKEKTNKKQSDKISNEERSSGKRHLPSETGGPKGPEPTRYGDWEIAGKCVDF